MDIVVVDSKIDRSKFEACLHKPFVDMIKFVVDTKKEVMSLGGDLHADGEQLLIEAGSEQKNLWGGNFYLLTDKDIIEYESLINIRPAQENRSTSVKLPDVRKAMDSVIKKLIPLKLK
jgi:hypothetical protein